MKTFLTKAQRKELMDEYLECLWHVDEDFTFEKEAETRVAEHSRQREVR